MTKLCFVFEWKVSSLVVIRCFLFAGWRQEMCWPLMDSEIASSSPSRCSELVRASAIECRHQ